MYRICMNNRLFLDFLYYKGDKNSLPPVKVLLLESAVYSAVSCGVIYIFF